MAVSLSDQYSIRKLVAAGNDEIWSESVAGTMTVVSGASVDTSIQLMIFGAYQKAYVVNGSGKYVLDFINTKLDLGSGNELTTPPLPGDTLTQTTSDATLLVEFVDSTKRYIYGYKTSTENFNTANTVSSDNIGGQTMDGSTFTPSAVTKPADGPHWYAWTKHPSNNTDLPSKAYLGCLYSGRAVLSGNPDEPYQWYMSRQGDLYDWTNAAADAQTPVKGGTEQAGEIGDVVRALIPSNDDFLIFGCANSMWVLKGDPAAGGSIIAISEHEGIYGAFSWCFDHVGNLWFLGPSGLNFIPSTGGTITNKSRQLPNLMEDEGADPSTHRVTMGYDHRRNGIHIAFTKISDGSNSCYWYDLTTEGFFPASYPENCGPYATYYYPATNPDYSDLLIGTKRGYIEYFDESEKNDDEGGSYTAIDSYVLCGPVELSGGIDRSGKLAAMYAVVGGGASSGSFEDSDGVDYSLFVADDPETLVENVMDGDVGKITGTWSTTGRKSTLRKKLRGSWMGLLLQNDTSDETWAIEEIEYVFKDSGKIK